MQPQALKKARDTLGRARRAVEAMPSSSSHEEFSDLWATLINATGQIHEALQRGAGRSGKAKEWYDQKNNFRFSDELLTYLHAARREEYHGLETSVEKVPGDLTIRAKEGQGSFHLRGLTITEPGIFIATRKPRSVDAKFNPSTTKLIDVPYQQSSKLRDKVRLSPPTVHDGAPIIDRSPLKIARLTLVYLERLLAEADRLAQS